MKRMKRSATRWTTRSYGICLLVLTLVSVGAYAVPIDLGTAGNFAVLAGSGVTNSHPGTYITGDVGSYPTPAVTGLTAGMVTGDLYLTGAPAEAKTDLATAYNAARDAAGGTNMDGQDLGALGYSLVPGVYSFSSSAALTGTLTLDGGSNPNAQWIFQIGSTLTAATSAIVSLTNGASPNNVFWQVGSSATINTNSTFAGVILASASITLGGGTLNGRALAMNGGVTISGEQTVTVMYTLTVKSGPFSGVSITGDKPGVTDYAASCQGQQPVGLSAPDRMTVNGKEFYFSYWFVDGQPEARYANPVSVTMSKDITAVVVYDQCMPNDVNCDCRVNVLDLIKVRNDLGTMCSQPGGGTLDGPALAMAGEPSVTEAYTLTVRSTPFSVVSIAGDKPGVTDYAASCQGQQQVGLSAPDRVTVNGKEFHFSYWFVDGQPEARYANPVSVTMSKDITAVVVYDQCMRNDVNCDCRVNVLDLIMVRNDLGKRCSQ